MSGYNPESLIADGFEYFGFAYLPQLITQNLENALVRGDLKKAIDAKCGAAGASNAAELETRLLGSDPMSRNRFGFRTSDMGAYRLRIPFTQRRIPFFWGPRNPYLLTWAAAHSVGDRIEKMEQANEIKDPVERQKALDAIGNKDLYWAAFLTGSAMFLADYNRGFTLTSRLPGISRWSALGSNSPYQQSLRNIIGDPGSLTGGGPFRSATLEGMIQCNGQSGPPGGQTDPEAAPAVDPATAPVTEAAPSPAVVEGADGVVDTVTRMSLDPDYTPQALEAQMCSTDFAMDYEIEAAPTPVLAGLVPVDPKNLAQASLKIYGGVSSPADMSAQLSTIPMAQGLHASTGYAPIIATPMATSITMPSISVPSFRPIMVRPMVFRPVLVP